MTEVQKTPNKKFSYFVGIDVSRNKLDYAIFKNKQLLFHQERPNKPDDIVLFINELKRQKDFKISKAVFCMEHTGMYCNHLLTTLTKLRANVAIENPVQIKNSLGVIRGKNDKLDSIRIAQYAQKNSEELRLRTAKREIILELSNLFSLRNRLLAVVLALKNPLKEQETFSLEKIHHQNLLLCKNSVNSLDHDIINIESIITSLIDADERLKRLKKLITSVSGVGPITAIQIIICTNEFLDISDPKKFACYSGVAPFKNESGLIAGKAKVSQAANKKIKSLLHICALSAVRSDEELKLYYLKKTKFEGKPTMAVINAIRYKIILRIFACVNQNRSYIKDYGRSKIKTVDELNGTTSFKAYCVG